MKIDNLDAVTPRIAKIAMERRDQFDLIPGYQFLADLGNLRFVADDDPEMLGAIWLHVLRFEHGKELVLAQLKEGVAFAFIKLLEIEDVLVERDCLLYIAYFDGDVVASVNLNTHSAKIRRKT